MCLTLDNLPTSHKGCQHILHFWLCYSTYPSPKVHSELQLQRGIPINFFRLLHIGAKYLLETAWYYTTHFISNCMPHIYLISSILVDLLNVFGISPCKILLKSPCQPWKKNLQYHWPAQTDLIFISLVAYVFYLQSVSATFIRLFSIYALRNMGYLWLQTTCCGSILELQHHLWLWDWNYIMQWETQASDISGNIEYWSVCKHLQWPFLTFFLLDC